MEEEEKDVKLEKVNEAQVKFRAESDRIVRQITNAEINEPLVEISGYDLQIKFNMKYLKSIEDIDAACDGISKLFRDIIMDELLAYKKHNE